ncbi:MAG: molybdopterin dinucleotide binding domain-containing protein [Nitrososphaerales archaeon]
MGKVKVLLITGRSMRQGVGKESGKASQKYFESVAFCEIHPKDLEKLGIKPGANVKVSTKSGSIVVKAMPASTIDEEGKIFIPYGPYVSLLVDAETASSGMPTFKGLEAYIEPALEEKILNIEELVKKYYRGK